MTKNNKGRNLEKKFKKEIEKIVMEVYRLGRNTKPFSDMESEFDLPCIDMNIMPRLLSLISQELRRECQKVLEEIEKAEPITRGENKWVIHPDWISKKELLQTLKKEEK